MPYLGKCGQPMQFSSRTKYLYYSIMQFPIKFYKENNKIMIIALRSKCICYVYDNMKVGLLKKTCILKMRISTVN